jgi:PAS domain S-box-containing protein
MTPLIGDAALPAEPALDSSAAIARLFEFASDLLATIDRAGHFTNLNPAWERTLGWSREELLGTRAVDLLHPHDLEGTLALNEAHRDVVPDIVEFENRYRCKSLYRGAYQDWNRAAVMRGVPQT